MIEAMKHWQPLILMPLLWFASAQTTTANLDHIVATVAEHPILEQDIQREVLIDGVLEQGRCPKIAQFSNLFLQSSRAFAAQKLIEMQAMTTALQGIAIDQALVQLGIKKYQALVSEVQNFQDYLECTSDTMANIEQKIRLELLLEAKDRQDLQNIKLTKSEIMQFYNTHKHYYSLTSRIKARMIVLPNRLLAAKVLESARKGVNFSTLANKYSIVGASEDGALGVKKNVKVPIEVEKSDLSYKMPEILIKEIFQMTNGGLSPIVSSARKHYLVKVEHYYPPRLNSLSEIYTQVELQAKKARFRELKEKWQEYIIKQANIKILDSNLNPIIARVNNQNLLLSDLKINFSSYEIDSKKLMRILNEEIAKLTQIQGVIFDNFQSIGNKKDRVDDFLRSRSDLVKIRDSDILSFYKNHINQYQESRRANEFRIFFKNLKLAEAFRAEGLKIGDIPKTTKGFFESEDFGPSGLGGTRSLQNSEMYSPSVQKNTENWSVTFIFFPIPAFTRTYQSAKDEIYQQLVAKERDEIRQRWIKNQLSNAKIENLLNGVISNLEKQIRPW